MSVLRPPCNCKEIAIIRNDFVTVAVFLSHLFPAKIVRAGFVGAGPVVTVEQFKICAAVVTLKIILSFLGVCFDCFHDILFLLLFVSPCGALSLHK